MNLKKYVKVFSWTEQDRPRVTLGPNTRIDPETHRAQLGTYGTDGFSTAADLYVKSWVANPIRMKQWLGFDATVIHKWVEGTKVTDAKFRLSDGTNQYWWNGSAWAVSVADWNTEDEIAAHIATFSTASLKLQVVVNLSTTDSAETPELVEVKVLFSAQIDSEIEDLIERSLLPLLRSEVRPVTRLTFQKSTSDNFIPLQEYQVDSDYRIVGIDAVFNHTADPDHLVDIYESHTLRTTPSDPWHDQTVDVITLSAMVTSGQTVWVRAIYEAVLMIETSRDWYQLAHIPAVVIESAVYEGLQLAGEDWVGNKENGTAVAIPAPRQGKLSFDISGYADKLFDLEALSAAVTSFFGNHYSLASTGIDETYRLRLISVHEYRAAPNENDVHSFRKVACFENFRVWDKPARDDYLVKKVHFVGMLDATIE